MKQKMIVVLLALTILLGISISLYMAFGSKDDEQEANPVVSETPIDSSKPVETNEQKWATESDSKKPEVEEKPSNPTKLEDFYEKPIEKEKEDIASTEVKAIENRVRSDFRKFQFQSGLKQLESTVLKIKNEGEGAILHQLNLEGTMLLNLLPAAHEEDAHEMPDSLGINNMLSIINDPENKLLGTLLLNDRIRVDFIVDQESLNPLFEGTVRIMGQQEVTGDELEKIRHVYEDADRLVRVNFNIESNNLYAYVLYFDDESSKLFGIYSEEENEYKTVSEWKKFYQAVYQ